jgi:hypothetical protein
MICISCSMPENLSHSCLQHHHISYTRCYRTALCMLATHYSGTAPTGSFSIVFIMPWQEVQLCKVLISLGKERNKSHWMLVFCLLWDAYTFVSSVGHLISNDLHQATFDLSFAQFLLVYEVAFCQPMSFSCHGLWMVLF